VSLQGGARMQTASLTIVSSRHIRRYKYDRENPLKFPIFNSLHVSVNLAYIKVVNN
jgi:hypothetical protein